MDMAEKLLAFDSRHPWGCGIGGGTADGRRDACSTCWVHGCSFLSAAWVHPSNLAKWLLQFLVTERL